jgi:hypothetical protein
VAAAAARAAGRRAPGRDAVPGVPRARGDRTAEGRLDRAAGRGGSPRGRRSARPRAPRRERGLRRRRGAAARGRGGGRRGPASSRCRRPCCFCCWSRAPTSRA